MNEVNQQLLAVLRRMKENFTGGHSICAYISLSSEYRLAAKKGQAIEWERAMTWLFRRWPGRSGDERFVVPSPDPDITARQAYMRCLYGSDKFNTGAYGELRLALLVYMIGELENGRLEIYNADGFVTEYGFWLGHVQRANEYGNACPGAKHRVLMQSLIEHRQYEVRHSREGELLFYRVTDDMVAAYMDYFTLVREWGLKHVVHKAV